MTSLQKLIKYIAIAFAVLLSVSIIGGILSAVGVIGSIFTGDSAAGEMKSYDIPSGIIALDIEIGAADFSIKEGDKFYVESNLKEFSVKYDNNTLSLKDKQIVGGDYKGAVVNLYIPKGTVFEDIDIETGAGRFNIDSLESKALSLEFGAGEVNIKSITATNSVDIDGGAGKITIASSSFSNLDLDMGVGQLNMVSELSGKCCFDLGVGETNITLVGKADDYRIKAEKGLGSLKVNGESVSGFENGGNAVNSVDINGGIGAININFTK